MKTFGKVWLGIGLLALGFGIVILALSFSNGGPWRDVPTYSVDESYDGIEAIDIQIGYGEVTIVQGDQFRIKAKNLPEDSFEAYVTDKTWIIRKDPENFVDLFGKELSIRSLFWWKDDLKPEITITIPQDFVATNFFFDLAVGKAEIEEVHANKGRFSVEAGFIKINQIELTESSEYYVGTGGMIINQMKVNNITVDCGVGDVKMEGVITGDNAITCDVGNIEMYLSGNIEDYSFQVDSGIGRVKINEESYYNIDGKRIVSEGAVNKIRLESGVGSIAVEIE